MFINEEIHDPVHVSIRDIVQIIYLITRNFPMV